MCRGVNISSSCRYDARGVSMTTRTTSAGIHHQLARASAESPRARALEGEQRVRARAAVETRRGLAFVVIRVTEVRTKRVDEVIGHVGAKTGLTEGQR